MNIGSIKSAFAPVKKAVDTAAVKIRPHLENIGSDVCDFATKAETQVKEFAKKPQVQELWGKAKGLWGKVKGFAEKPQVKELWDKVVNGVKTFTEKPQVQEIWKKVTSFIKK